MTSSNPICTSLGKLERAEEQVSADLQTSRTATAKPQSFFVCGRGLATVQLSNIHSDKLVCLVQVAQQQKQEHFHVHVPFQLFSCPEKNSDISYHYRQ